MANETNDVCLMSCQNWHMNGDLRTRERIEDFEEQK